MWHEGLDKEQIRNKLSLVILIVLSLVHPPTKAKKSCLTWPRTHMHAHTRFKICTYGYPWLPRCLSWQVGYSRSHTLALSSASCWSPAYGRWPVQTHQSHLRIRKERWRRRKKSTWWLWVWKLERLTTYQNITITVSFDKTQTPNTTPMAGKYTTSQHAITSPPSTHTKTIVFLQLNWPDKDC